MFKQDCVLDAIYKNIDSLKAIVVFQVSVSIILWWAGSQGSPTIKALSIEISRDDAYWIALLTYLTINAALIDRVINLNQLLNLLDRDNLARGIALFCLHPWILNPFSCHGETTFIQIKNASRTGMLIVLYWVCHSSLFYLSWNTMLLKASLISLANLFLFLIFFRAIGIVINNLIHKVESDGNQKLVDSMKNTKKFRLYFEVAGTVIGLIIFTLPGTLIAP